MEREDTKLYQVLGVDATSKDVLTLTEKDIASAYRKASLKWHPDKNPNNPTAAKQFTLVRDAYEILSTPAKRKHYDDKIRQVRRRRQAFEQMDHTRRQMRHHLQQRERNAATTSTQPPQPHQPFPTHDDAAARMQKEMAKLRKQAMKEHPSPHQEQPSSSQSKPTEKKTDGKKRSSHTTQWAKVPGFTTFKSQSSSLSFDDFERAVLEGRNPFPE